MVEQVEIFKYMGTKIDHNLSFIQHADGVYKKAQACRFHLRSLKAFNVIIQDILPAVYWSINDSVFTFSTASWYNFLKPKCKRKKKKQLTRIIEHATTITGTTQTHLSDLLSHAVKRFHH